MLLAGGTIGYRLVEGWSYSDALYMAVITLTTVGFSEVHPMSEQGRNFTMALALGGVFSVFYAASEIIRGVISGEVRLAMGRQRMERSLAELDNHLVVCGYGRLGRLVCQELSAQDLSFVVIEHREEGLRDFKMPGGLALHGDATSDDVLKRAGVERARGLVTVAASDADNLFITMSARFLNDKLDIVARAESEGAEPKLLRAGASRVVSPYTIGGQRVAQAILRPAVMDFIELATRSEHLELQIEETKTQPGSALAGKNVKDSGLRQDLGIIVVAIKRPNGRMVFNPASDEVIAAGDLLITLGPRQQLDRLEKLTRP